MMKKKLALIHTSMVFVKVEADWCIGNCADDTQPHSGISQ